MTNINKLIENEGKRCADTMFSEKNVFHEGPIFHCADIDDAFQRGARFAIFLFRWRKVDEELPEVKDEGYFILCKTNLSQKYSIVFIHNELNIKRCFKVFDIIEWKLID